MDANLVEAIKLLSQAGVGFVLPSQEHLAIGTAAARLDCNAQWIRTHLDQFPNAWRMPGGEIRLPALDVTDAERRRSLGELRIPSRDIDALAKRNRIRKAVAA